MERIDHYMALLVEAFGPMGPVYVLGAFGLILILSVAPLLLTGRADPIEKLGRPRDNRADPRARDAARRDIAAEGLRYDQGGSRQLEALGQYLEPKDEEQVSSTREMLLQAGYRSRSAVQTYFLARAVGAVLFGVVAAAYMLLARPEDTTSNYLLIIGGALLVGYMAPNYWVTRRRDQRREEIGNGFPDALDMMLVCVEAGQSLDQSLARVANEISHAHPALAEEFQIVAVEIRAGRERSVVLRDFAARSGVGDISSFVTVLIQSTQFGTSVAEALRIYAAEMRDKRMMRAEEKANTLPTKLTLGTMMFTVPPLLIILIGPSIVDIINALGGMRR
ncbi:MAG: type II secretion system F family protein [Pseudomonadota bacterium]